MIFDVIYEDSIDFGNKVDDNMELILEDINVRFKNGCINNIWIFILVFVVF